MSAQPFPAASSSSRAEDSSSPASSGDGSPARVPWRGVVVFLVVAYALFALAALPFWILDGGITHPLYTWVISAGMFAPTIATVIAVKVVEKGRWRRAVGLRFRGLWGRIALWSVLGVVIVLGINIATALILVLRGVPSDPTGRTWAQIITDQFAEAGAPMSTTTAV
ncbi:MAG: CPBP family intramembrane metalloprotease, partial [Brachybacterium sp.]|nr:CPBP family intramembrane metalloprotease [Brachybacterium sp.]